MADPNPDVSDFEGFSDSEGVDLRQGLTIDSDIELETMRQRRVRL